MKKGPVHDEQTGPSPKQPSSQKGREQEDS